MNAVALVSYFLATFGVAWMLCMRASDWNTIRWAEGTRWMKLIFGALVWLVLFTWVGERLFTGNAKRSDAVSIAMVAGLPVGIVLYALVAWLWPGTAGALRMAPSAPPIIPKGSPKGVSEWLVLDLRAIPTLLRRRKAGKK